MVTSIFLNVIVKELMTVSENEIILARIADIIKTAGFFKRLNSEFLARFKCVGLAKYYDKYSECFDPFWYNNWNGRVYENSNDQYNVFFGLDSVFTDLYRESKHDDIIKLLAELPKSFNVHFITENLLDKFSELQRLYELLGLHIEMVGDCDDDTAKFEVSAFTKSNIDRVDEMFSVEAWLNTNYSEVYEAYESAIDSYKNGSAGACIESCRTCIVSLFSKFQGTEEFATWLRGVFTVSGDSNNSTLDDLVTMKNKLNKSSVDLATFFDENKCGKLAKTKAIYTIYSMMSDYGTHRNESSVEIPTIEDALLCLRFTETILIWVYSKKK